LVKRSETTMDEFQLIDKYFKKLTKNNIFAKNLNDDVFYDQKKKLVVSIDTYNEGIHFPNFKFPDLVIKKIIRSSLSDLISKGVKPTYYFISASGNKKAFSSNNMKKLSKSLHEEQKKYNIKLSGGDTTYSNKINFSITVIGFSNNIIERNKAKLNDDIYVTGNIGDSYIGLKIIENKIKLSNRTKKYFINKYYKPDIPIKAVNYISKFARTSMDVSDGLFSDMNKLINNQKLSFKINLKKVPISNYLSSYLKLTGKKKLSSICNGDDYQILFTSSPNNKKKIQLISNKMNHKITKIGKIVRLKKDNTIIIGNKSLYIKDFRGYYHKF